MVRKCGVLWWPRRNITPGDVLSALRHHHKGVGHKALAGRSRFWVQFWCSFGGFWETEQRRGLSLLRNTAVTDVPDLSFPPFRLDRVNEQLWRGDVRLPVRPKPFALLRYLVEHAGRLVTKEALTTAVWPDTRVGDGLVKGYVRDLRKLLGDDADTPRFIATVASRGYRFIAPVTTARVPVPHTIRGSLAPTFTPAASPVQLVGRDTELASLHGRFMTALSGQRQLLFVTGEPGIGKTTLVDAFLEQVSARGDMVIGRGQCVAQYGAGEAYLPLLEALGWLGRTPAGARLCTLLRHHGPSWLVQLPALLGEAELEALGHRLQGVSKERMLRELAETLELFTAEHPLVLVLEDLHWSDVSTVDLLTAVAQRRGAARLLVIGTYRPAEVIVSQHPLKAVKEELQLHGQCTELPLTFLTAEDVTQHLTVRFPQHHFPHALGPRLQQYTEGNPLFLVTTVEDLLTRGVIVQQGGQWNLHGTIEQITLGIPVSVQQLVARHFERLTAHEQEILEAASVAGESFAAAAVAAGVGTASEQVETCCEGLARREQFLREQGVETWPDGTVCGRYGFVHALYRQEVYEQIGAARRMRLHHRIGARRESGYGERASEIATELALHFEQGQEYARAVRYVDQAGKNALQRSAYVEAISHFTKGLALLTTLPDTPERLQQELSFHIALGTPLMATKGFGAPEVERSYARARELCQQVGETPQLVPVLWGLAAFYGMKGDDQSARDLEGQVMRLAQHLQDPVALLIAHRLWGVRAFFSGKFPQARTYLEQVMALYDRQQHHALTFRYGGYDPGVHGLGYLAGTLWHLGHPEQALRRIHEALTLAQDLSHPNSVVYALNWAAVVHWYRREEYEAQQRAEAVIALSTEHGLPYFVAEGMIWRGWALAAQGQAEEGIAQIRHGITSYQTTGARLRPEYHALLAEAYGRAGQAEEALRILAEPLAVVSTYGERYSYTAELYRLKGELTLHQGHHQATGKRQRAHRATDPRSPTTEFQREAEAWFLKAIKVAQRHQAKSLELRATISLARLWQHQGKQAEAHGILVDISKGFTEGFDTKDLQEAKALLDMLV